MRIALMALALLPATGNATSTPPPSNARFQVVQLGVNRHDQYLLDTQTGRVWTRICLRTADTKKECVGGDLIWDEMYVDNLLASKGRLKTAKPGSPLPAGTSPDDE